MMTPVDAVREGAAEGRLDARRRRSLRDSTRPSPCRRVAVTRELGLDPARVNVHGGAVALGHPDRRERRARPDDAALRDAAAGRSKRGIADALPRRRQRRRAGGRAMSSAAAKSRMARSRHVSARRVIGAGTMGNGIAQVFAQAGFDVLLHDTSRAGARSRAQRHREEPRQVRREGQADRRRPRRRRSARLDVAAALDALPPSTTSSRRSSKHVEAKRDAVRRARSPDAARRDPRVEHVVDLHHAASAPRPRAPTACSACTS